MIVNQQILWGLRYNHIQRTRGEEYELCTPLFHFFNKNH